MDPRPAARRRYLDPNPALWEALERGPRLRRILADFYARVYADARLAPFFHATSIDWVVDHQYAFLAQIFGGERLYFGERPRNAHHWMVISDELFDHREALMASVLRAHGLDEAHIAWWRGVEECFRSHIVKDAPFAKVRGGVRLPLEGHERLALVAGGVCDECAAVIEVNGDAWYHVRTGKTFCAACARALEIDRGASSAGAQS